MTPGGTARRPVAEALAVPALLLAASLAFAAAPQWPTAFDAVEGFMIAGPPSRAELAPKPSYPVESGHLVVRRDETGRVLRIMNYIPEGKWHAFEPGDFFMDFYVAEDAKRARKQFRSTCGKPPKPLPNFPKGRWCPFPAGANEYVTHKVLLPGKTRAITITVGAQALSPEDLLRIFEEIRPMPRMDGG